MQQLKLLMPVVLSRCRMLCPKRKLVWSYRTSSTAWIRRLLLQRPLLLHIHQHLPSAHCGVANLTNTAPLSPRVLAALVSQLRTGSKSLLIRTGEVCSAEISFEAMLIRTVEAFSTEVSIEAKPRVDDKPAYTESMSDTRELSHRGLEDIVVNLRNQSKNDDQASVSDESDYESDDTDQVLAVNEHIAPMAEPYWCADYEFSNSYDDELWLSAMTGVVANLGKPELSSPSSSSSPVVPVAKTITVPQQWGDAPICWYSALRECWTEAKMLPAQEELARDGPESASMEHIPQGSVPGSQSTLCLRHHLGLMTFHHGITDRLDQMVFHLALRLMSLPRLGHTA